MDPIQGNEIVADIFAPLLPYVESLEVDYGNRHVFMDRLMQPPRYIPRRDPVVTLEIRLPSNLVIDRDEVAKYFRDADYRIYSTGERTMKGELISGSVAEYFYAEFERRSKAPKHPHTYSCKFAYNQLPPSQKMIE